MMKLVFSRRGLEKGVKRKKNPHGAKERKCCHYQGMGEEMEIKRREVCS